MEFIERIAYSTDHVQMMAACRTVIESVGFGQEGQISLKSKQGHANPWKSGVGSFYDFSNDTFIDVEDNYTCWNLPETNYIRQQVECIEKHCNFVSGRVRIMALQPKQGLSVHHDLEIRYHYVLDTNPYSYFCHNTSLPNNNLEVIGNFYHIPADSHWYTVDTTKTHWVYNGGKTTRLHLVVCSNT